MPTIMVVLVIYTEIFTAFDKCY